VLLTDFGQSEHAGVMKGVILSIAPDAKIVDLCHNITAHNIIEASWILKNNYRHFPKGSVFCCVVDPGVGTQRRAVAVKTENYFFVAPDNGLLWETIRDQQVLDIREIPIAKNASRTFHGRDVFAPAAARIDTGDFGKLGDKITQIQKFELLCKGGEGLVVRIDTFGNIVTNLPGKKEGTCLVQIGGRKIEMQVFPTYDSAPAGQPFLITGSCNTLEISLKNGNANSRFKLTPGTSIQIT